MPSRSATTPAAPACGNSSAATAEPNCTDSAAPSTSPTEVTPRRYVSRPAHRKCRSRPWLCSPVMTAELRHLRAFLAIAAERSITRAAVRLHVTQPALSRTLRQLETHLGVRLIDRSTHHLELTAAGRAYRDRAAAAVAAVDDVLDPARAGTHPLRLGHAWSALGEHTTTLLRA